MISSRSVSSLFIIGLAVFAEEKKRTNGSKQEARSPPAAIFDAAGSLRASCLGAHARDSKLSPLTATTGGQNSSGF